MPMRGQIWPQWVYFIINFLPRMRKYMPILDILNEITLYMMEYKVFDFRLKKKYFLLWGQKWPRIVLYQMDNFQYENSYRKFKNNIFFCFSIWICRINEREMIGQNYLFSYSNYILIIILKWFICILIVVKFDPNHYFHIFASNILILIRNHYVNF